MQCLLSLSLTALIHSYDTSQPTFDLLDCVRTGPGRRAGQGFASYYAVRLLFVHIGIAKFSLFASPTFLHDSLALAPCYLNPLVISNSRRPLRRPCLLNQTGWMRGTLSFFPASPFCAPKIAPWSPPEQAMEHDSFDRQSWQAGYQRAIESLAVQCRCCHEPPVNPRLDSWFASRPSAYAPSSLLPDSGSRTSSIILGRDGLLLCRHRRRPSHPIVAID